MDRASVYGDMVAEGQKASALYLPGVSGNYVSCPSSDAFFVGDIDTRIKIISGWLPAPYSAVISKGNTYYYEFRNNAIYVKIYDALGGAVISHAAPPEGYRLWLRHTFQKDIAGQSISIFYHSLDGENWVNYSEKTAKAFGPLLTNADALTLGEKSGGGTVFSNAIIQNFELRNGIDGPIVASWDGRIPATRQRDPQGNIWTVNGTANGWVTA